MESTTSHVTEEKKRPTNDNNNNKNKNKDPMYYVLEGPYPQSIEETADPSDDKPLEDPEEPIYCSLDEVIPVASETPSSDSDDEYEYNVLEREDYRGSKVPLHYVQMSSDGQILKSSEIPHSDNSKNHPDDIEGNDEPIYSILERRYFGGSKVPSHYVEVLPNGSGFNILDKLKQDTFKGSKNDNKDSGKRSSNGPKCANEPAGSILEGRYLEGSDVPGHCLQISPKEPVYSILDRLYRQSIKESPYYPKRGSRPLDNTLEERFLGSSKDPEHEERMAPNVPVYSILEKLYRQSIKAFSYDPKHGKEPEKNSLEVRYLERSEVPENYVQVSGPVFSILEKLYRQSIKGSTYSPNRGKEPVDKTLEERHLEGSEDPKKDERVDPNEPVYSILERLYRQSVKESSGDPKCANNQADNTLEERYLERSEVPENYVQMSGPVFSILEKLYRQSVKGSSYAIKCANEPDDKTSLGRYYESSNVPKHYAMPRNSSRETTCGTKAASEPGDRILEECYLEGSEVPENYVQISPNGPVFSILERLYRKSIRGSSYLPQSAKDPDEKPLEGCYFEGSEVPEHYVWISRRRSASKARNSTKFKEANHDLKAEDEEQVETLLEERYFEGSEVPNHYVRISRDGSVFSIIERSKGNSVKGSNHDSDSADEEVESILEGRYFEGSEVPERYERICRKGSVFSILDKPNQKSVKFSDDDSKPTDEQVDMCLEGRYFEGSEIPERYVRISRKGSIFSILDKSNRKSIKDFDDDPKPEDEKVDSILEGRYFEGSEVPDHYVRISRKGSVFSIIESDRKSVKGSNHDPKETDEQGGSTLEGRYFRASKVPRRYVRFSRKETVFSIADESVKGPSDDPNPADEPANLEGRYFEGSEPEVPENYATNVPVYSILERLYRQSTKGSRCDPKRANEPDEKILEGGYFEESEVAEHYVLMPTLNALEKLFRKSIKGFIRDPDEKHGHHDQPEEKGLKGSNVEGSSSKETDR